MRVISPVLKHLVYPGLAQAGYFRRVVNPGPIVITYHGVMPANYDSVNSELDGSLVSIEGLRAQLALISQRYKIISPQQYLDFLLGRGELPRNSALLTCDDGLRNIHFMLPVLSEAGVKCLFFITGFSLEDQPAMLWHEELCLTFLLAERDFAFTLPHGQTVVADSATRRTLWWKLIGYLSEVNRATRRSYIDSIQERAGVKAAWREQFLALPGRRERFSVLGKDELRHLIDAGHTIGAHSMSHPLLSRASDNDARFEIVNSREELERAAGQPIWAFAYPFGNPGSATERDFQLAERAGFQCAFLNTEDELSAGSFAIPRVHVTREMSLAEFEAHVSGFHQRIRRRFRQQVGA